MANAIDLVVAQQAMDQLASLIAKLNEVDAKMLAISKNAISLGGQIGGINTPSGGSTNGANNASINASIATQSELNKKLAASIQLLQAKYTELTRARGNGQKTLLEEQAAVREQLRLATLEAKAVNDSYNAYQKKDAEYKKAVLAAKELGAVHGSTSSVFLKEAAAVNKLADELKAIDAKLGNHTRSVGNYASGWNGLSNSINQLTREAPAFANSMQTGFMAISNNIPILVDELINLKKANADVVKGGGQAKSMFSSVASAVFSWQTALSVGVTLLTIYGKDLIDLAFGASAAEKSMKQLRSSLVEVNVSTNDEVTNLRTLNSIIQDTTQSHSDRKIALDQLSEIIPEVTGLNLDNASSLEKITELTNRYVQASLVRMKVDVLTRQVSEDQLKLDDLSNKSSDERLKWYQKTYIGAMRIVGLGKTAVTTVASNLREEEALMQSNIDKKIDLLKEYTIESGKNDEELQGLRDKNDKKTKKKGEDLGKYSAELRRKELELELAHIDEKLNNEELYYTDRLVALDKDFLKRAEIAKVDYEEEFRLAKGNQDKQKVALINFQLEKIKLLEEYNKKKNTLEALDLDPVTELAVSKNQDKDPFKSVIDSAKNAVKGLKPHTDQLKSDWKETFNAIAESAQKAGDIMAEFSDRNFKNEYARLEAQKDIALKFAGDSVSAKTKIEEEYNKRQRDIANRENKAKQKQAIFNIAIDTAQAVMATVGKTGFAGLPLALILSALGAAQIAMVASQKIPQYFDGGVHDGGLAMINDGGGSNYVETVVTPDGKVSQYSGRDVVTNLPKGTEIFTPEQWQEKELHNMLQSKGISMNVSKQNGGMTAQEMDMVLAKHFKKIQTTTMNIDKNGFSMFTESNGNKTIRNANRVSGTGFKI